MSSRKQINFHRCSSDQPYISAIYFFTIWQVSQKLLLRRFTTRSPPRRNALVGDTAKQGYSSSLFIGVHQVSVSMNLYLLYLFMAKFWCCGIFTTESWCGKHWWGDLTLANDLVWCTSFSCAYACESSDAGNHRYIVVTLSSVIKCGPPLFGVVDH